MSDKPLFAELTPRESDAIKGGASTNKIESNSSFSYSSPLAKVQVITPIQVIAPIQAAIGISVFGDAGAGNILDIDAENKVQA